MTEAAYKAEKAIGHGDNAVTAQDVTNPGNDREKYGDPNVTMKALAWMGKNKVEMSKHNIFTHQFLQVSNNLSSRVPQAKGHRRQRCHSQDHR